MKKIYGLLGSNISYSLSPKIHNHWAKSLAIDAEYVLFDIPEDEDLKKVLDDLWSQGVAGFNITKPFKTKIPSLLSQVPHLSSYNTIYRGKSCWEGTSTDGPGFVKAIEDHLKENISSFDRIIFLGAGGAVLGLLEHMSTLEHFDFQNKNFYLMRRSETNDHHFKKFKTKNIFFVDFEPNLLKNILSSKEEKTLLVQATSAPLLGNDLKDFLPCLSHLKGSFYDMVYQTPSCLVKASQNIGIKASDGLSMLIEQARLSQMIWWGKTVAYKELEEILKTT